MFKKFAAQKIPIIPSEDVRREVNNLLGEDSKYWNRAAEYATIYFDKDDQKAKNAYDEAIVNYHLMQKTVAKIIDVWPQGVELVKEIQEMVGLGIKMAENDYYCGRYTQPANMDKSGFSFKSRDFVTRRHGYADMIDKKQLLIQKLLISSKINQK